MRYSEAEILQLIQDEDVHFIRLSFCDIYGNQKNLSILPSELKRAFRFGISFDASAIPGFGGEVRSDLFLRPDPATLCRLPWRSQDGKVLRMYCDIVYPNGKPYECDSRYILREAVKKAASDGLSLGIGPEMEFYLFKTDAEGHPTRIPLDNAGYMDMAPEDRGEDIRRDICYTLSQMGIRPECAHHEEGPGQNEVDFHYSDPLTAADNATTFKAVVRTLADMAGLHADFSPKPIPARPGNGLHINFSANDNVNPKYLNMAIAGVMEKIEDITLFLNPTEASYERLGSQKAPKYISWSPENRSQLIRVPAATKSQTRAELRSADPSTNPYLAFALLLYAGAYGIKNKLTLCESSNFNFFTATADQLKGYRKLPASLTEARRKAAASAFVRSCLPAAVIEAYLNR